MRLREKKKWTKWYDCSFIRRQTLSVVYFIYIPIQLTLVAWMSNESEYPTSLNIHRSRDKRDGIFIKTEDPIESERPTRRKAQSTMNVQRVWMSNETQVPTETECPACLNIQRAWMCTVESIFLFEIQARWTFRHGIIPNRQGTTVFFVKRDMNRRDWCPHFCRHHHTLPSTSLTSYGLPLSSPRWIRDVRVT